MKKTLFPYQIVAEAFIGLKTSLFFIIAQHNRANLFAKAVAALNVPILACNSNIHFSKPEKCGMQPFSSRLRLVNPVMIALAASTKSVRILRLPCFVMPNNLCFPPYEYSLGVSP